MSVRENLRENWTGQLWTAFAVATVRGLGNLAFRLPYVGGDSVHVVVYSSRR